MNKNTNNWTPFWFETNQAFGECYTRERWLMMKALYIECYGSIDYSQLRMNQFIEKRGNNFYSTISNKEEERVADFGHRREHAGSYTLEQFALDNGVEL